MTSSPMLQLSASGPTTAISAGNNPSLKSSSVRSVPIHDTNSPSDSLGLTATASFDDAVRQVHEFEARIRTDQVRPASIHVAADWVTAADHEYSLEGDGLRQFCQSVGAPHTYLVSLPSALRVAALQHHLDQRHYRRGPNSDEQTTIISRDGRFLAFGRSDLQSLTGLDVLSAVRDGIGETPASLAVSRLSFDGESFVTEIVSRQVPIEVRPGDVICGGLRVTHSHLGAEATSILSFVLRLVCANGLVHRECTGPRRTARTRRLPAGSKGVRERQLEQVRRLAHQSWSHTQRLLNSVQHLREESVSDPRSVFERYLRNARLYSQALLARLLEAWAIENSERTAFGVLNAMTRVATHEARLSERQRRAIAALAGIFAQKNTHVCPYCFSVLSTAT